MSELISAITKGSPLILTVIAFTLLANPSLAIVLILDYLVLDPVIRRLIHAIDPNFHLPGNHVTMHMILLTYVVIEYLRHTDSTKTSVTGFMSYLSDNKMKLILALAFLLAIVTIIKSDRSRLETAVAVGIGITIGLIYSLYWNSHKL